MLRTASSLPLTGLLTLGSDPARFQTKPPACYRASWQLPGPDFHRQATTSLRTARSTMAYVTVSPPALLGARKDRVRARRFRQEVATLYSATEVAMPQKIRWLVALSVTVAVLAISIWVSGAYLLPLWVNSGSDRWVIASSIGVSLAAFAALWGANFSQDENDNISEVSDNGKISPPVQIHMKAKADGSGRIYQALGDQTINDR